MTVHWHRCDRDPCDQPTEDLVGFALIIAQLDRIENIVMSQSADIEAAVTTLNANTTQLGQIQAAVDVIKARTAGAIDPSVFTDLDNAIAGNTAAEAALSADVAPPAPPVVVPPTPKLPEYTFSGDPTTLPIVGWTATGTNDPNGNALYTFSGDTAGSPATGDGADGGVWHLVPAA